MRTRHAQWLCERLFAGPEDFCRDKRIVKLMQPDADATDDGSNERLWNIG
jgi:hypothetical protein